MVGKQVMLAAMAGALLTAPAQAGSDATGTWRMANGKVTVKVTRCGANLCGKVVGLRKPRDDKGRPRLDKENPNPSLRSRPVIGLTILRNMRADGEGYWTGTIYNPDDGKTYSSYMTLQNARTMKVDGCVAMVFCRSMKFVKLD
ncbi:MAG: DUF2147 domain-containing protein [Aestuariivirga sp.]|uniref:DUF2147 domain-containing protein n=1 Tax=Aestuariivirga sp. TaxID=2650926 RepID=UPI0038D1CC72